MCIRDSDSTGWFAIFNVPPGKQLLLGKASGLQKGIPVEVFADSVTIIPTRLRLEATTSETVSFSGTTQNLQGSAMQNITVTVLGGESTSSDSAGNFTFPTLPANSELIFTTSVE